MFPKDGGLYFSEDQPADLWGEEETILLGRSDFSSTCGLGPTTPEQPKPLEFLKSDHLCINVGESHA